MQLLNILYLKMQLAAAAAAFHFAASPLTVLALQSALVERMPASQLEIQYAYL